MLTHLMADRYPGLPEQVLRDLGTPFEVHEVLRCIKLLKTGKAGDHQGLM